MKKRITVIFFISFILLTRAGSSDVWAQLKYTVVPESPRPGDPVTIGVNDTVREAVLFVDGKQTAKSVCFSVPAEGNKPGFMAAIITIPSTVTAKDVIVKLNNNGVTLYVIPIFIAPREFRSETLALDPALTSLVADPNPQRTAESEKLWEILVTNGREIYHSGKFVLPVTATRRTSQFGTRRINQYSDGRRVTSIHAGVDFGIPTGTEVYACGRGKVVFSKMRILTGNSVIIEHAPGVYSLYYHLDSLIAEEGTIVEAGAVIALSGSTGFSTGPHLHWELRVSTENTDPDVLVNRPLIDKDLIISKIFN
jgi:murein DD-endopeptidase MepM/ murein hydrolase activator NlpD